MIDKYEAIIGRATNKSTRSNVRSIDIIGIDSDISSILQKLDSRLEQLKMKRKLRQKVKSKVISQGRVSDRSIPVVVTEHFFKECPKKSSHRNGGKTNPAYNQIQNSAYLQEKPTLSKSGNMQMSTQYVLIRQPKNQGLVIFKQFK